MSSRIVREKIDAGLCPICNEDLVIDQVNRYAYCSKTADHGMWWLTWSDMRCMLRAQKARKRTA